MKTTSAEFEFDKSEDPLEFLNVIKTGKISLEEAKNLQQDYEKYLKITRKGGKSDKQKETLANINIFLNARNNAIKFIEDYGSMSLEAKRLAKQKGKGLNSNSESLLNEIRQTVYSLYQSKEITKKVYNNITKSMKV